MPSLAPSPTDSRARILIEMIRAMNDPEHCLHARVDPRMLLRQAELLEEALPHVGFMSTVASHFVEWDDTPKHAVFVEARKVEAAP